MGRQHHVAVDALHKTKHSFREIKWQLNMQMTDIEMGDICTDTHSGVGVRQEAEGVVNRDRLDEGLTDGGMVVDQAVDNECPIRLGEERLIDAEGNSDDMNVDENGVRAKTSFVSDGRSELDGDSLPKRILLRIRTLQIPAMKDTRTMIRRMVIFVHHALFRTSRGSTPLWMFWLCRS